MHVFSDSLLQPTDSDVSRPRLTRDALFPSLHGLLPVHFGLKELKTAIKRARSETRNRLVTVYFNTNLANTLVRMAETRGRACPVALGEGRLCRRAGRRSGRSAAWTGKLRRGDRAGPEGGPDIAGQSQLDGQAARFDLRGHGAGQFLRCGLCEPSPVAGQWILDPDVVDHLARRQRRRAT